MKTLQKWVENSFMPWKKQMETFESKQNEFQQKVKSNAREVKFIVALLLENKPEEAIRLWNDLDLEPELVRVQLDIRKDKLIMEAKTGNVFEVSLGKMIQELQLLFT